MKPDYCLYAEVFEEGCWQCSLSSYGRDCRMNKIKEEEKMRFEVSIPGRKLHVFEASSYEEAVDRFEQELWDAGLLADDDVLTASDIGIAGGKHLADVLERQGFIRYGDAFVAEA